MYYTLSQVRRPNGWLGRLALWIMNSSHSEVSDWGLSHVNIGKGFIILDVGCGGGRTIQKMAGVAREGKVYGIDPAASSVIASASTNKQWIKEGRVEIKQAQVSHLPFPDNYFDLVTAVETHYYWSDVVQDFEEIRRALKPSATFVVIAENYPRRKSSKELQWLETRILKFRPLSVAELREVFLATGFSEVQIFEEFKKGWLCGTGRKPI
jgi:SAM-dependent methyltransferase